MDTLWQKINEAIHRRDTEAVNLLIPKYLRAHHSSSDALYEASEFFRKIADYASALRILPKEPVSNMTSEVTEAETKLELQLARILNILGASNYALRMIHRIRQENRAKSKVEMVEIYHCNYRYSDVVELVGQDYPIPNSEPWHQDWLLHFYLANAQSGLKQTKLAVERVQKICSVSASPLIQAIARCYHGQFLVEAGRPDEALHLLLESQRYFEKNDQTSDHGILQKWLGICFLKLKRFQEAENALKVALTIFYQPALKPEDWMEIILWLDQIPGYRKVSQYLAPRLSAMAGPDYAPLKEVGLSPARTDYDIFSISQIELTRKPRHIERESDTAWVNEKARLGLDLVDELVSYLIYAGEFGLPQYRLYELLWPNEPFSFDQHKKRLENLVLRARAQGNQVVWKDLHLRLDSTDVTTTSRPGRIIRGYSFLKEHPVFCRQDVEKFFGVSSTTAKVLCRGWIEAGYVSSLNKSQYQVHLS